MNGNAALSLKEEREIEARMAHEWEEQLAERLAYGLPTREDEVKLAALVGKTISGVVIHTAGGNCGEHESLCLNFTDGTSIEIYGEEISTRRDGLIRVCISSPEAENYVKEREAGEYMRGSATQGTR